MIQQYPATPPPKPTIFSPRGVLWLVSVQKTNAIYALIKKLKALPRGEKKRKEVMMARDPRIRMQGFGAGFKTSDKRKK